jgi:hypothetical protein
VARSEEEERRRAEERRQIQELVDEVESAITETLAALGRLQRRLRSGARRPNTVTKKGPTENG